MKKVVLMVVLGSVLSGCSEKTQYEQTVLEQIKQDKDIIDYKLDPERMANCVVDLTSGKMPGLFAFDPRRMQAYRNYSKMLTLTKAEHPDQVWAELQTDFGSTKGRAEARSNYTEGVMNCIAALLHETEGSNQGLGEK